MATTYGSFPGVQVTTAGGGISGVVIGSEEHLVLFGEADYARDGQNVQDDGLTVDSTDGLDSNTTTGTINEPEQIGARGEADSTFGDGSELANAMKDALANGANIDFLYGVAPQRYIRQETLSSQTGTLSNTPIFEDEAEVWVDEEDGTDNVVTDDLEVRFVYKPQVTAPSDADTVHINPFTGEFAANSAPTDHFRVDYRSVDYESAISASAVSNVVGESETGIYAALSEDDDVSSSLQGQVSTLRTDEFKLINALMPAETNDNQLVEDSSGNFVRYDARYNTSAYANDPLTGSPAGGRQSVDADYFFKFAPTRQANVKETIMGGVGGLFAGNPIQDPIYNDSLNGFSSLEQSFSLTEANDMRDNNIIPIRQAGTVRVKDNLSTSTEQDWERDFWRRRITDRVILIAKEVGDAIIGRINDEDTRNAAQRQIESEMRTLVSDRLIRSNADDNNWFVDVYESSTDPDEVKIDIGFTPYGIVKRIDTSVTINT